MNLKCLAILSLVLVAGCGVPEAPLRSTPTASVLPSALPPTPTTSVPPTPALPPTQSPSSTERPASTAAPTPNSSEFVLVEEYSIGGYAIRLWQPVPGTGMYQRATLSTAGQPEVWIEAVSAIGSLPAEDVTGDGFPDVWFETKIGGHRCCWGTIVYNLGPTPEKVLDISSLPDYYGTGTGAFEDLDGDGRYEFITRDPLTGSPCTAPTVKAILQYVPGQGYVGAGPRFPEAYANDIAAHTRRAEEDVELSRAGYKCGVYELIADYLYSGQPDRARQELTRLYFGSDVEQFWSQLEWSASAGRFFLAAASPSELEWKPYVDPELESGFEHLAQYEQEPMKGWGCGLRRHTMDDGGPQITFGTENHLSVLSANGLTLGEYADLFIQQVGAAQYARRDDARLAHHDPPGIVIETVIMRHSVLYALFEQDGKIYSFSSRLSLACSAPELGIVNPEPFWHAVESFQLWQ